MLAALRQFFGAKGAETTRLPATPSPPGFPLIILGMHRSGTSFLTGTLQQAGLALGAHSTANTHNARGNRENPEIVAFHDAVLAARGATWKTPPGDPVVWTAQERAAAQRVVAAFGTGTWGFKDPRALLMAECWRDLCPGAGFAGIFRNPAAVFRSLRSRNAGFSEEMACALWRLYNERLLALHERAPFPLFCFDDSPALLHERIAAALPGLGLGGLGPDLFFSSGLRHHDDAPLPVPPDLRNLHDALRARRY